MAVNINDIIFDENNRPIVFEGKEMTMGLFKSCLGRTDDAFVAVMDKIMNLDKVKAGKVPKDYKLEREAEAKRLYDADRNKASSPRSVALKAMEDLLKEDLTANATVSSTAMPIMMSPAVMTNVPVSAPMQAHMPIQNSRTNTARPNPPGGVKSMDNIQHVNIKLTKEEFINCIDGYVDSKSYLLEDKPTKASKIVSVFTEKDLNGTEVCTLMMNNDGKGNLEIVPFKFSSRNYITNLSSGLHEALCVMAENNGGDYVAYFNDNVRMYIEGKSRRSELKVIEKGTKLDFDTPVIQLGSTIKKTIKEYLVEDKELADLVKNLGYPANINFIGKYLMQKKIDGKIEASDFIDLFRQVGLLGANDPTILKFYTFFK